MIYNRVSAVCSTILLILSAAFDTVAEAHDIRAANQRIANTDEVSIIARSGLTAEEQGSLFSIVNRAKLWGQRKVTVCFGPKRLVLPMKSQIKNIESITSEWTSGTVWSFDFGNKAVRECSTSHSADIRVNLANTSVGFTSLVGKVSSTSNLSGVGIYSMSLPFEGAKDYLLRDEVIRFYVLHEFGHALGFEHEAQRRECNYDYQFVKTAFNFPNIKTAKANMKVIFSYDQNAYPDSGAIYKNGEISTKFDNDSVMKYNLSTPKYPNQDDPRIYIDGVKSVCFRPSYISELSPYDRNGVMKASQEAAASAGILADFARNNSNALSRRSIAYLTQDVGEGNLMANLPDSQTSTSLKRDVDVVKASGKAFQLLNVLLAH